MLAILLTLVSVIIPIGNRELIRLLLLLSL